LAALFLAGAFTLIAGYVLLTFLERSLYPDLGFYALPLEWAGGYAAYRYARLAQGVVAYRPPRADYVVAAVFSWFLIVLLRQVRRADERPVPLWRKLWRPHGPPARAARAVAAIGVSPLWLMSVIILRNEDYLSTPITVALLSLGILFANQEFRDAFGPVEDRVCREALGFSRVSFQKMGANHRVQQKSATNFTN